MSSLQHKEHLEIISYIVFIFMNRMTTRVPTPSIIIIVAPHMADTTAMTRVLSWAITTGWELAVIVRAADVVVGAADAVVGAADVVVGAADVVVGAADVVVRAADVVVGAAVIVVGVDVILSCWEVGVTGCTRDSSESRESLKQWGESKAGTVSPHGPGDIKYNLPLRMIVAFVAINPVRLAFKAIKSNDDSYGVEYLTL